MKILFDQGVPKKLRRHLPPHEVRTAYEAGLHELQIVPELLLTLERIGPGEIEYLYASEKLRRRDELKGQKREP